MRTRLFVGSASFLAALGAFELSYVLLGTPRAIGPVIGLVLSTLICLDPGELFGEHPSR